MSDLWNDLYTEAFDVVVLKIRVEHPILDQQGLQGWVKKVIKILRAHVAWMHGGNIQSLDESTDLFPAFPEDLSEEDTAALKTAFLKLKEAANFEESDDPND